MPLRSELDTFADAMAAAYGERAFDARSVPKPKSQPKPQPTRSTLKSHGRERCHELDEMMKSNQANREGRLAQMRKLTEEREEEAKAYAVKEHIMVSSQQAQAEAHAAQMATLEADKAGLRAKYDKVKADYKELLAAARAARAQCTEQDQQEKTFVSQIEALTAEVETLTAVVEARSNRYHKNLDKIYKKNDEEVSDLKAQLGAQAEEHLESLEHITKEKKQLTTKNAKLEKVITDLKNQPACQRDHVTPAHSQMQAHLVYTQTELAKAKHTIEVGEINLKESEARRVELGADLSQANGQVADLVKQVTQQAARIEQVQKDLQTARKDLEDERKVHEEEKAKYNFLDEFEPEEVEPAQSKISNLGHQLPVVQPAQVIQDIGIMDMDHIGEDYVPANEPPTVLLPEQPVGVLLPEPEDAQDPYGQPVVMDQSLEDKICDVAHSCECDLLAYVKVAMMLVPPESQSAMFDAMASLLDEETGATATRVVLSWASGQFGNDKLRNDPKTLLTETVPLAWQRVQEDLNFVGFTATRQVSVAAATLLAKCGKKYLTDAMKLLMHLRAHPERCCPGSTLVLGHRMKWGGEDVLSKTYNVDIKNVLTELPAEWEEVAVLQDYTLPSAQQPLQ